MKSFGQVGSWDDQALASLDKETSGVMVVAKTQEAYLGLVQQFSDAVYVSLTSLWSRVS